MATQRRRRRKNNQGLKVLIGILILLLIIALAVACSLSSGQEGPTTQSTETTPDSGEATQPAETDETTVPTETNPTGWQQLDGKTYYWGDDGVLRTGAVVIDEKRYCFGQDGALLDAGWQTIGKDTYYVSEDGTACTGWLELEDNLYYLRQDGRMARGQLEIEGQTWFFTSTGAQIYMVNPWNSIPEDYDVNLVKLSDDIGTNRYVADYCYEPLMDMVNACKAAMEEEYAGTGRAVPDIWIRSANRSNYDQTCLFEDKVKRVKEANPGYTQAQAEAEAATVVAVPGTSEHQLGLAVDIIDTQIWGLVEEQEDLPAQKWLMEHCWEYGFILRFPKGTTDITGIIYEPWHYRYVGLEVAAEIHESGLTLEEYIAALTEQ